jgi:uncharacterized protein YcnI
LTAPLTGARDQMPHGHAVIDMLGFTGSQHEGDHPMSKRSHLGRLHTVLLTVALASPASLALAHPSVAGPGLAGKNQVLSFSIGHGCEGADTVRIEVAIPSAIMSVRAVPSTFGPVTLTSDDAGVVTKVTLTKADDPRELDEMYYQFSIRVAVPDAPFTTLLFPTTQVCRAADGTEITVEWAATPEEIAAADAGAEPEPAPSLVILPARAPGWNVYEAPSKLTDLSIFDDAEIVWVGDAAYSANPTTMAQIEDEEGVTKLTEIAAGAEIWVKY